MEESNTELPLIEKELPPVILTWMADAADLFVLLCSFLLAATSIVFVALVFHTQATASVVDPIPRETLSVLQRVISSLSVTITSTVIMVLGKRYVLFKLARGGLRSRRVAVYSNPSIGNFASYLVLHGAEFPLLGLSAVWGLALVTSLTVDDSWGMASVPIWLNISVPSGSFIPATPGSSWTVPASEQLDFVLSSLCLGVDGAVGLINVTSTGIATDHPVGIVYYPPLPHSIQNAGFSFVTAMNGFNISMEQLSSVPTTAQNLTCTAGILPPEFELWFDGSDNETVSIIALSPSDFNSIFRFNATAIIMGGTLSSTGNYTEFALNGTSWPNVMPADSQWAQDITTLICNTTFSPVSDCTGSFSEIVSLLNTNFESLDGDGPYTHWSSVLSMALGAYSSAMYPHIGDSTVTQVIRYSINFTSQYGVYILILHIIVSLVMLFIVVRLRLASRLGPDFINSTRLLLDPLKKPELFNASLETTVGALEDPYMIVTEDSEFLVAERKSRRERRKRIGEFTLRNPFDRKL